MSILLAGGGLLNVDFGLAFWILITFVIFLALLRVFAWEPIMNALERREQSIKESLEAAEKAMEKAEQISKENDQALKEAEQKAQRIRKEAIEEAEELRRKRIEKSKKEADDMLEQARDTIEREKKRAMQELHDEVARLAIESASRIIDAELDEQKNRKLVNEYIQDISNN